LQMQHKKTHFLVSSQNFGVDETEENE